MIDLSRNKKTTCYRLKFKFSKTGETPVLTGNDGLTRSYLFGMTWHKIIPFIQVFKSWISIYLPNGRNTLIRQNI